MDEQNKLNPQELNELRQKIKAENPDTKGEQEGLDLNAPENIITGKEISIEIAEDNMSASLWLADPGDEKYSVPEVIGALRQHKVVAGIKTQLIMDMVNNARFEQSVVVAEGVELIETQEGYYEFKFETEERREPAIREDGTVDYGSMGRLQNVKAGDVIAIYHQAIPGKKGYNVLGQEKNPKPVRELAPLRGKSIERNDETGEYKATLSGKISYNGGNIEILNVHEINDDVTLIMGKVEFYGDLIINGNVEAGVTIRAGRNVTISGTVSAAFIYAGGDIILQKGIQGGGKGIVSARGNVFSDFIEYATVKAREDIYANSIINSEISTEGSVIVSGKYGSIIGGHTHGLRGITSNAAGNYSEIKTYLHAGAKEEDYYKYSNIVKEEKATQDELNKLGEEIGEMLKQRGKALNFAKPTKAKIAEVEAKKNELCAKLDAFKRDKEELNKRMARGRGATITIHGSVYRNVVITIDAAPIMILQEESFMRYSSKDGVVQRRLVVEH